MGDSVKEFLRARSRPIDDIPSEKHPDGKSYVFSAPKWKTSLALKAMYVMGVRAGAGVAPDGDELDRLVAELAEEQAEEADATGLATEEILYRKVMGSTYDELVSDGVDGDTMEAVFQLLFRKYGGGQDIGVQLAEAQPADVEAEPSGEAAAQPNRATRRAARPAQSKSSPASGPTPSARTRAPASKTPAKTAAKRPRKTA